MIEKALPGYANGISTFLHEKIKSSGNINESLSYEEKQSIIENASVKFGEFLDALGVNWKDDPNSRETPLRVAKAYVNDLWAGRYNALSGVTTFPADGYNGIVQESRIPLTSMCSHHHQMILGEVNIAYVPTENSQVVGLSKLNRIVEHYARRGSIQEQLTVAIHNAVNSICQDNIGVAVMINATHACVYCRGVKHIGPSMQTAVLSGCFMDKPEARAEFYKNIELAK